MEEDVGRVSILNEVGLMIKEEDHTLMNVLKWSIGNNWTGDKVEFCGYNIPHPSESVVHLSIQFEDRNLQAPNNLIKKLYEGIECIELIAERLLRKIEDEENVFFN